MTETPLALFSAFKVEPGKRLHTVDLGSAYFLVLFLFRLVAT
jgi:hypothetical protein